jgi:hypothetical protein
MEGGPSFICCYFELVLSFTVRHIRSWLRASCFCFAQMRLEFGERHLDWVQVWTVGREKEEPRPALFKDGFGLLAFVARQVIKDDHVTALERRS